MFHSKQARWTAPVLGAILVVGGSVAPVTAAQDPGVAQARPSLVPYNCLLTRVGDQFVRCDNLTGAGLRAPAWISE
jgi:hypothetical protein